MIPPNESPSIISRITTWTEETWNKPKIVELRATWPFFAAKSFIILALFAVAITGLLAITWIISPILPTLVSLCLIAGGVCALLGGISFVISLIYLAGKEIFERVKQRINAAQEPTALA